MAMLLGDGRREGIAQAFASEAGKLQQYLTSQRLIGRDQALTAYALANQLIRDNYDISASLATGFTRQALIDLQLTDYWPALRGQVSSHP